jgi:hypothetical protein
VNGSGATMLVTPPGPEIVTTWAKNVKPMTPVHQRQHQK